ncbi:MAG: efflux RND transporter permease subunit [Acidobacteriota bacterium]
MQYPADRIRSLYDLRSIPLHGTESNDPARLDAIMQMRTVEAPTEIDRYQLRRVVDVYVNLDNEDLGRVAQGMRQSFTSFGGGLVLAVALLYLVLVAQFRSFLDPLLILLAVPPGLGGVVVLLYAADTTLSVMSPMGVVMRVGLVVSNSILLVDFAHKLRGEGYETAEAMAAAARPRLRPILMTSLATVLGLAPIAAKMGAGTESYAPPAQAIIGGLLASLVVTLFLVPAAYLLAYRVKTKEGQ